MADYGTRYVYRLEDRLVELGLAATLFHGLAMCDVFAPDPEKIAEVGEEEAQAQGAEEVARMRLLLTIAAREPFEGIYPEKKRRNLQNRVKRLAATATKDLDQALGLKVAMVLYYWIEDLLQREYFECPAESAMGQALGMMFEMFKHGFEKGRLDSSAQKRARKLHGFLQEAGYFPGVDLDAGAKARELLNDNDEIEEATHAAA